MDRKAQGLFHKFNVERTDGTSAPGGKHDGCDYFVLDITHDPHAKAALRAYAASCRADYPALAADLDAKLLVPVVSPEQAFKAGWVMHQAQQTESGDSVSMDDGWREYQRTQEGQ